MTTIAERLLRARARMAAEMCGEAGMTPGEFNKAWAELEPLELAKIYGTPEPEPKPLSDMTPSEKTEWRLRYGDAAFIAKIREENRR